MTRLYPNGLMALLLALTGAPSSPSATDLPEPPFRIDPQQPPGEMVDVGGYRLHIICRGAGPAVILDAGLGGFSLDWMYVQQQLVADARVCAYDRAGYGWSDPGPAPRVTEQIAGELEVLLARAGVPAPYVLVGHSFGGYNMSYFAATHPGEVAGLVLVDASHPDQAERLSAMHAEPGTARGGTLVTFFDPRVIRDHFPEHIWYVMASLMASAKAVRTEQRELTNFTVSAAQVKAAGPLPRVPLVVVSRGRRVWPDTPMGDALEQSWAEMQAELAAGVPGGRQIRAERSGHLVHLEEPGLVAAAVRDVLREACRSRVAVATGPARAGAC
ncbi:MAG: alpha/beta hydrolase [Gammaproteobacteria bacterium]|nr:alpha/beta hydrolase [Gammaproteobacteria bacterium]